MSQNYTESCDEKLKSGWQYIRNDIKEFFSYIYIKEMPLYNLQVVRYPSDSTLKTIRKNYPKVSTKSYDYIVNRIENDEKIPKKDKKEYLIQLYNTLVDRYNEKEKKKVLDELFQLSIRKNEQNFRKKEFRGKQRKIENKISTILLTKKDNDRLDSLLIVFNYPKKYDQLFQTINSTPLLRNSLEKKIQTYYYTGINSIDTIRNTLLNLYNQQNHSFKISLSFGYIFEKAEEDMRHDEKTDTWVSVGTKYEYVVFRPSNSSFFIEGKMVNNRQGLNTLINSINIEDLENYINNSRPDSAHKIIGIYSMGVKIMKMDKLIGASIELPPYLKDNPNFVNPESVNNMCFWNCFAYHETKNKRCAKRGKELFTEFYGIKPSKEYGGIEYFTELDRVEELKNIGINIYEVSNLITVKEKVEMVLDLIRKSKNEENVINLLNYGGHFIYISRLGAELKTNYCCQNCGQYCPDMNDLKRHLKFCETLEIEDKFVAKSTIYEPTRNLIILFNEMFGTDCDFRYNPIIVYDFESLCIKRDIDLTTNLSINNEQKAVSVSLLSNIEGYEKEIFIENKDVTLLFQEMFLKLDEMTEVAINKMKRQFLPLYEAIKRETKNEKQCKRYLGQLKQYCYKVPVLGFNSGKYDINLNIKEFMNEIHKRGNIDFVIKNGNTFKALMANNFIFLDICQYLPAGFNLDNFVKAFNPNGLRKSIFPYEFLDSYEKLDYSIDTLTKKDFYSSLKNSHISEEEWNQFLENKTKFQWRTVRDLLEYYNNLDVKPFLQSIIKQREFFYDLGIDMFKDGFSLPALAEKIMFSYEFKDFNENFIHQKIPITEKYPKFESNWKVKKRNYMIQDKENKRYSESKFIDITEVSGLYKEQNGQCLYCWKKLQKDWSLDRINNNFGHDTENCVISCIPCNVERKDENFSRFYRRKALLRYAKTHPMIYLITEENKEVFYKLKNNICGGASIVFHRYHEAEKTKIRRPVYENGEWKLGEEGKTVKNITGFDANALYLWCLGNSMPCGDLKYTECDNLTMLYTINGFLEVDIETPEELYNRMGEFPVIFKNVEYNINEEVGETMNEIFNGFDNKEKRMTKKLISSFKGEKVLIKSDRLKWLMSQGLMVTKMYGYIECEEGRPFKNFMEKVSDERRKGDIDPNHAIIAEMWKLVGNSAFGRTGMNKSKFNKTLYGDESKYFKEIGTTLFKDANQYGDLFEITKRKKVTQQNMPIQVACSVYDDAKLLMSQFYYDCIDKFIDRKDFQYIEMDTDSAYMALTDDFEKLIKPEMKDIYEQEKHKWFMRTDTKEHKDYDKRKPGLFKPEFIGKGIVALSSKMYYVKGFEEKDKYSCKGIQKKNNVDIVDFEKYKQVVLGEVNYYNATNKGMRIFNSNQVTKEKTETKQERTIYTYEMNKIGLTSKYDKRIILEDKISSVPLNI